MSERRKAIIASALLLAGNVAVSQYWRPSYRGPANLKRVPARVESQARVQPAAGQATAGLGVVASTPAPEPPPRDQAAIDAAYRERGFVRVPLEMLPRTPISSPIILGSTRRVPQDVAVLLDLSYSEIQSIADVYDRVKPRIQEIMDRAASVEVRDDGLLIQYRFDPNELTALTREIDQEILAGLDSVSQQNYEHLDRRMLLDSFAPYPLRGLTIEVKRSDSLIYTTSIKSTADSKTVSGFRTGSGAMALDDFYGSLVRQYFPRAVSDEAEFAARQREENKSTSK